jgi:hypothetical protein
VTRAPRRRVLLQNDPDLVGSPGPTVLERDREPGGRDVGDRALERHPHRSGNRHGRRSARHDDPHGGAGARAAAAARELGDHAAQRLQRLALDHHDAKAGAQQAPLGATALEVEHPRHPHPRRAGGDQQRHLRAHRQARGRGRRGSEDAARRRLGRGGPRRARPEPRALERGAGRGWAQAADVGHRDLGRAPRHGEAHGVALLHGRARARRLPQHPAGRRVLGHLDHGRAQAGALEAVDGGGAVAPHEVGHPLVLGARVDDDQRGDPAHDPQPAQPRQPASHAPRGLRLVPDLHATPTREPARA